MAELLNNQALIAQSNRDVEVLLGYESRVWEGETDMDGGLYKFAKADIGGVWAYRIIFDIPNCSPARASKLVDAGEGSLRLQFDANIKGYENIATIDATTKVVRSITHAALMGLISSRDFIDACTVRPLPDGGLVTAASAVEGFPETPGCVRGKNRSCGLTFRPTPSGVKICWVIHSELGGSLPVALIDRAIPGSAKNLVLGLQKAVNKLNLAPDL